MGDHYWTDKTGRKQNIKQMETSHLINVAKTVWNWALRRIKEQQDERELYERTQMLLPGMDEIEEAEPDYYAYTADHYAIFEPILVELEQRSYCPNIDGAHLEFDYAGIDNA